jgi:hypothetical protein
MLQAGWRCCTVGGVRARSGYFGRMARPGRSEDTSGASSVPIWLKLSAVDSAKMDQVLARPEFEGWTKGEWCLEIIQTALRYYTRPRPAGEPGRRRAPARSAAAPASPPAEPVPPPAEAMPPVAEPAPEPPVAEAAPPVRPAPPRARPARTTAKQPPAKRTSPSHEPEPVAPEPEPPSSRRPSRLKMPQPPEPAPERPQPERPRPERPRPEPPQAARPEPVQPDSAQLDLAGGDSWPEVNCSHPAEARDYQSGTCAACGAILWD